MSKQTVISLKLPNEQGPFVIVRKKHLEELRAALLAIVKGEEALRAGKTRRFKDFVQKEFPAYGKNL
jgi:hypothetical protein